jgi:surface protein
MYVCIYVEECCLPSVGCWSILIRVLPSAFVFLRVDCECNRPSFLATVFAGASAFDGDLSQWDVASVTDMNASKSTRIVENDLT